MKRSWLLLALAICLAFGLRALLLVDATALWSDELYSVCLLYTSPSPRDRQKSRMPSSA